MSLLGYFKEWKKPDKVILEIWERIESSPYHKLLLEDVLKKLVTFSDGGVKCCSYDLPRRVVDKLLFHNFFDLAVLEGVPEEIGLKGRVVIDKSRAQYHLENCECSRS